MERRDYMNEQDIYDYIHKYGITKEESDNLHNKAREVAEKINSEVTDEMVANTEVITYDTRDFKDCESPASFTATMFMFGERFSGNEDIEVQYTKREDKYTGDIYPTFVIRNLALIERHRQEEEARKQAEAAEKKRLEAERRKAEFLAKQQQKS